MTYFLKEVPNLSNRHEKLSDLFFSEDNFNILFDVFCTSLQSNLGISFDENSEYKTVLFDFMSKTYDSGNCESTIDGLNKECLKLTFKKIIDDKKKIVPGSTSISEISKLSIEHDSDNFVNILESNKSKKQATDDATLDSLFKKNKDEDNIISNAGEIYEQIGKTPQYSLEEDAKDPMKTFFNIIEHTSEHTSEDENLAIPLIKPRTTLGTALETIDYISAIRNVDINSGDRNNFYAHDHTNLNAYSFSVSFGGDSSLDGLKTQTTIKNVTQITLNHIVIPNISDNIARYPYLYLHIAEFPGQYIGTSDHSSKAFARILRDKDWETDTATTNLQYCVLYDKHSPGWVCETPLASINKLTFRILNPIGELIRAEPDFFDLNTGNIFWGGSNFYIILPTYFTQDQLNVSHKVIFKNIEFSANNNNLKLFLENPNGHIINEIAHQSTHNNSFKSSFKFPPIIIPNYSEGKNDVEFFGVDAPLTFISGILLNVSKQTSVSLQFTTRTYKSFVSEIV
jgi:hypothetical protein